MYRTYGMRQGAKDGSAAMFQGEDMQEEEDALADRLIAHRGYAARYPENTLLAVERALQGGARYIEVDIQLTADLEPVLYHDRDMVRLSDVNNKIQLLTYDDLERFSLFYPQQFGDRFRGESIGHLQHLVDLMPVYPEATFFIEFKRMALENFGVEAFLNASLPLLKSVASQVVIISYSPSIVVGAHQQGWPVGLVMDKFPGDDWQKELGLVPDYLFMGEGALAGRDLEEKKTGWGGTRVAVYEVADAAYARQLFAQGVDLVETFDIDPMRQALA